MNYFAYVGIKLCHINIVFGGNWWMKQIVMCDVVCTHNACVQISTHPLNLLDPRFLWRRKNNQTSGIENWRQQPRGENGEWHELYSPSRACNASAWNYPRVVWRIISSAATGAVCHLSPDLTNICIGLHTLSLLLLLWSLLLLLSISLTVVLSLWL